MKKIGVSVLLVCTLLVCTVSPIFADPNGGTQSSVSYDIASSSGTVGTVTFYVSPLQAVLVDVNSATTTSGSTLLNNSTFLYDCSYLVSIIVKVNGSTDYVYALNQDYLRFNFNTSYSNPSNYSGFFSSSGRGSYIDQISDNCHVLTTNSYFYIYPEDLYGDRVFFPGMMESHYSFVYHEYVTYNTSSTTIPSYSDVLYNPTGSVSNLSWYGASSPVSVTAVPYTRINLSSKSFNLNKIARDTLALRTFIESASSSSSTLRSENASTSSQVSELHSQEQQYYQQNSQAIESTGLSNFNYTQQQLGYFEGVVSDFQGLWNSLGSWTFVYTFTLMLSFATFVLRHRPHTRSSTKSSGGNQNASS